MPPLQADQAGAGPLMRRATPRPQGRVPGCPNPCPPYLSGPGWPRRKRGKRGKRCARPPWLGAGAGARRSTVSAGGRRRGGGGGAGGGGACHNCRAPPRAGASRPAQKDSGEARLNARSGGWGRDSSGPTGRDWATLRSRGRSLRGEA